MGPSLLKIVPLAIIAGVFITTGLFFIGGQFFKEPLAPVYNSLSLGVRTALALVTFFAAGNALGGWMMTHYPPELVSPILMACQILVQLTFTIFIAGGIPSLWIIPAALLVAGGSAWVTVLLQQG